MARGPKPEFELPVAYGDVSIGDKTCRISVTVSRGNLTPNAADKQLCGKRLIGEIISRPEGSGAEQGGMFGSDGDTTLKGAFDVKAFSVTQKQIKFGLTFALASIETELLAHFAKREGMFRVYEIDAIPEEPKPAKKAKVEEDEHEEETEDE